MFFFQFCEFNDRFLNEISYYKRPLETFIGSYEYKGEFSLLLQDFLTVNRKKRDFDWLKGEEYSFLKQEEKTLIYDYFQMLGKGDSVSQKNYFSSTKDRLLYLRKETAEICKKYGDLYLKIGFLIGLLVLILIM